MWVWWKQSLFCCWSVVAVMLLLLHNITRGQYRCRCCAARHGPARRHSGQWHRGCGQCLGPYINYVTGKRQLWLHGGEGDREQHPGAALPAPSLPRPGQCGGVWLWWWRKHGVEGVGDQSAAAFDPRDTSLWRVYSVTSKRKCDVM